MPGTGVEMQLCAVILILVALAVISRKSPAGRVLARRRSMVVQRGGTEGSLCEVAGAWEVTADAGSGAHELHRRKGQPECRVLADRGLQ